MNLATAFNVGDMAVYPAQGVTEITGIETLEISGTTNRFYVLRCLNSEEKIRVPIAKVAHVGLRSVVDRDAVGRVMELLQADALVVEEPNWNRRYRRYVEKIKTGSLLEIAQVLRDLHLTKADKQLSYGERRVFETARELLVQELAVAQATSEEEVAARVDALLT
jgi:CarD family transcriptional regulator